MSPSAPRGAHKVAARRVRDTPIVEHGAVPGYGAVFNAGAIEADGVLHLFARGVREGYSRNPGPGARYLDYVSDVLVFTSRDGMDYEFQQVLAAGSPEGVYSFEDPRVQRVRNGSDDHVMMTYTSLPDPASGDPWRVGVHRLVHSEGRFALNRTSGRIVGPEGVPDKDAVLFNLQDGRVAMIHRIHPDMQLAVFESLQDLYEPGAAYWATHLEELEHHTLIEPSPGALGVGAGAPPLETEAGLLLFYHERGADSAYTINVALLDPAAGQVKSLLTEPVMRPELRWEREGDVDNVVFVQGAVPRPDGTIYLTYGAADRCIGAATIDSAEVLEALSAAA